MEQPGNVPSQPILQVSNVVKEYGTGASRVRALDGVNFVANVGEFVCIMGPSGSGKSTLMHIMGCLDRPTSGQYLIAGQDVASLSREQLARVRGRQIGFVFQSFNLLARATALENVELPMLYAGLCPAERDRRARKLLGEIGLGDRLEHRPNELSGGQQQRVAIARALANGAPILLADEPTGNLDSASGSEIMALFRKLRDERGLTVIVVTHAMDIAAWGDRVVSFRDGNIMADAPAQEAVPAEIYGSINHPARRAEGGGQ
jgi:putative ABC transport system ATP-binding protein